MVNTNPNFGFVRYIQKKIENKKNQRKNMNTRFTSFTQN